jgi:hypothetical protein
MSPERSKAGPQGSSLAPSVKFTDSSAWTASTDLASCALDNSATVAPEPHHRSPAWSKAIPQLGPSPLPARGLTAMVTSRCGLPDLASAALPYSNGVSPPATCG